jgi:3-methylcrotonyl-CoA carboxylase alpha subunit
MEMNTRLQVEHPVTEMITGQDLVEWQIRVASGEPLPLRQEDLKDVGNAIEVRLYAEDPERDFLPQTGRLTHLAFPPGDDARVDTGVRAGDAITVFYDPMIAKLIVWGRDRRSAVARLRGALARTRIAGLATNLRFLQAIAAHPAFAAAELDTGFIERHRADLLPPPAPLPPRTLALGALGLLLERANATRAKAAASADPHSPWNRTDGWRLGGPATERLQLRDGAEMRTLEVTYLRHGYRLDFAAPSPRPSPTSGGRGGRTPSPVPSGMGEGWGEGAAARRALTTPPPAAMSG